MIKADFRGYEVGRWDTHCATYFFEDCVRWFLAENIFYLANDPGAWLYGYSWKKLWFSFLNIRQDKQDWHGYCCSFVLPGRKDKNPMPPKAAREGSKVKPEIGIMAFHRKCRNQFLSLPGSGIFTPWNVQPISLGRLSQFLQETEKKKRKSNRSTKSC